jgi:hypothetical protein
MKKLRSIQRCAAVAITGALPSTPTDALDALANLLPVEFMVENLRYRAALRLTTLPNTHPLNDIVHEAARFTRRNAPHPTPVHDLMADFDMRPWTMEKISVVRIGANWKSGMALSIGSSKAEAKKEEAADGRNGSCTQMAQE